MELTKTSIAREDKKIYPSKPHYGGLELRGGSIKALCELDPGCLAPEWVAHSLKSPKEQFEFFAGATFSGHQNMVGYCSLTAA